MALKTWNRYIVKSSTAEERWDRCDETCELESVRDQDENLRDCVHRGVFHVESRFGRRTILRVDARLDRFAEFFAGRQMAGGELRRCFRACARGRDGQRDGGTPRP